MVHKEQRIRSTVGHALPRGIDGTAEPDLQRHDAVTHEDEGPGQDLAS